MTVREAYLFALSHLSEYEVRIIFEELWGYHRLALMDRAGEEWTEEKQCRLTDVLQKRRQGVPLQYILGKWTFMGRDFYVGPGVLIPRDDTEVAVRECMDELTAFSSPTVMDLCAGSGIIAITLAKAIPGATIIAVEKEPKAFAYLEKNIRLHRADNVTAVCGDIFQYHQKVEDETIDGIISNPPYIRSGEMETLQTEVRFEPVTALNGGKDGLDFYRCLAKDWTKKLRYGGSMTLEIGEDQAASVRQLLCDNGMSNVRVVKDIQGLDRVIFGTKKQ